ncbi:hypothetical protein HPP92_014796 [Vanilla planifolia]|uniref:Uncharacterized protein n=1 Tax=Vanilla planifolia TaxID=51239 RepID=A0A835QI03_VANPL|nr:hypothetical protein HPP92_014796 [Vanilla planifolia]
MEYSDQRESKGRWFCSSVLDATAADSSAQYENYTISVKSETEQLELSDLELENLITMESNRGEVLLRKMNCLKGERDELKRECEELKASQRKTDSNTLSLSVVEEIKQELQHERSLNANLRLQLHKTQEANSELILAVQDLEQLLEQKNTQIACPNCTKICIKQPIQDISEMNFAEGNSNVHVSECEELFETTSDGDDEQYQLDVLVNRDDKVDSDLKNNIDVYKVHQEDLQMQMEKLALKYEILKQENADLLSKLEQARQEEIINQQRDCSENSATISDLKEQINVLKNELQERSRAYDASLEVITNENFKQQKRAKEAEDALWMTRLHNAKITERLQEEFEILAGEITSTFHMNEKLAIQALAEANEIHLQKCHLEEQLEQNKADIAVLQERHEVEVKELSNLVDLKTKEIGRLQKKSEASDNQNKMGEAKIKALSENIFTLKTEVQKLSAEKVQLCEQIAVNKKSVTEIEQLKDFSAEVEKTLYEKNLESEVLKNELASMREEADKLEKGIYKLQQLVEEKEMLIKSLNSEIEIIKERSRAMSLEEEIEKKNLLKQICHLQSDLKRKDDTTTILEKKLQEKITRSTNSGVNMKTGSSRNKRNKTGSATQSSSDVTVLYEKIKLLEEKLKLKDAKLENTMTSFLNREKHLNHRIEELERDLLRCDKEGMQNIKHNLDGDCAISIDNELALSHEIISLEGEEEDSKSNKCNQNNLAEMLIQEQQNVKYNQDGDCAISIDNELTLSHEDTTLEKKEQDSKPKKCSRYNLTEMLHEMAMLRENNKSTEAELKEMQQRYTQISLRFAEVEGERQQLVMTVRNLKNAQKI